MTLSLNMLLLSAVIFCLIWPAKLRDCDETKEYRCKDDDRCIPRTWLCDGDEDCKNGDDEHSCESAVCDPKTEFSCNIRNPFMPLHLHASRNLSSPSRCIPLNWKCDGDVDCIGGADELNCQNITCQTDEFLCPKYLSHPAQCIPMSWKCDGENDCVDMSDEQNCQAQPACSNNLFQCNNRVCIYKKWVCDGDDDCGDNSDESPTLCPQKTCDPKEKFQCHDGSTCIDKKWVCDGEADCRDRSDELHCTSKPNHQVKCHHVYEFKCHDGAQCINKNWLCDGEPDCADESDESQKECGQRQCSKNEKKCDMGSCLPLSKWCDGKEDCFDGSDEKNCPTVAPKPETCDIDREYTCPGKPLQCVKYDDLCVDGKANNDCVVSVCSQKIEMCDRDANNYCKCRTTRRNGTLCYCESGFQLKGKTCVDIDECKEIGRCAQICKNVPGSYECDCYPGYHLNMIKSPNDGLKVGVCRAIGKDPLLLLSNRAAIRRFDLVTNKYEPLVAQLDSAVAMDFLLRNNTLIWSDVSKEKIMICHMGDDLTLKDVKECKEGSNNITLVDKDISTPDGLAVDWVHQLLFWTDTGLDQINVVDLATRRRRTLFSDGLDEPRAIAVDPLRGLIFWTDWGANARIERAGMDGHNRTTLISGDLIKWPNGIALDLLEQRVYWADAKAKLIMSCDYWGREVRMVLHSHEQLKHPFSITVFEERLFWTDWDREGVLSANKFTGGDFRTVMHGISGPMTVRVYHKMAQPDHPNKCSQHECEHICLPRSHLSPVKDSRFVLHGRPYTCSCENGFYVSLENENICVKSGQLGASSGLGLDGSTYSLTTILLIVLSASFMAAYLWYRKRPSNFSVLHVDNPIYRPTVEEIDADMDPFSDGNIRSNQASNGDVKLVIDEHRRHVPVVTSDHADPGVPASIDANHPTDSMTAPLATSMVV